MKFTGSIEETHTASKEGIIRMKNLGVRLSQIKPGATKLLPNLIFTSILLLVVIH